MILQELRMLKLEVGLHFLNFVLINQYTKDFFILRLYIFIPLIHLLLLKQQKFLLLVENIDELDVILLNLINCVVEVSIQRIKL